MKLRNLIGVMALVLFSTDPALAREYKSAGETANAYILVDVDQLRKMSVVAPIVLIKTIRHYKTAMDLSIGTEVASEGYSMFADCDDRSWVKFWDRRFYDSNLRTIKEIDYTDGNFDNLKQIQRTSINPGSAEAIAVDYACTWINANKPK